MLIRHFVKFSQPSLTNNLSPASLVSFLNGTSSVCSSQQNFSTQRKNIPASIKQKDQAEEKITSHSQTKPLSSEGGSPKPEILKSQKKGGEHIKNNPVSENKKAEGSKKQEKVEEKRDNNTELQEKDFEDQAYEKTDPLKWHRKWGYRFLRVMKWVFWLNVGYFTYHMVVLKYYKQPNLEMYGTNLTYFTYAMKFYNFYYFLTTIFTRPPVAKLLPDKPRPPPGYQVQKTLVLNLNGTLVHSQYKLGIGFELLKRPGLMMFLQRLARHYEIVIFADQDQFLVTDVVDAIDPTHQMILIGFGRESTVLEHGEYIKDLRYLNRPLQDLIMIDTKLSKVKYQPDNVIVLPHYKGDPEDASLHDLLPLLEHLAKPQIRDVREQIRALGSETAIQKYREVSVAQREKIERKGVGSFLSALTGKK